MVLLYMILGAFARRWYGGALENYKILKNRSVQTITMLAIFLSIYVVNIYSWQDWFCALTISCWLQFQFWSRGHGCAFDCGRGGYPDKKTLKRYNERWYHYPCDWLASKNFFSYYGVGYDFSYMTLRYTCPLIPFILIDWHYILTGLAVSIIYLLCWMWYNSTVWLFNKPWCHNATELAEIICGALVYSSCYLLGR